MKKLVLIIDDEEPVRIAFKTLLPRLDCEVLEATTPEEAKEKLQEYGDKLDVVILDLCLLDTDLDGKKGEESGLKVLQEELGPPRICERCGFPRIRAKVIVLTAHRSRTSLRAAFLAGAFDYIPKTEPPEVAIERVKEALRLPRPKEDSMDQA